MSKSSTRKRVILAGILIGGKYAFARWKNVARLISNHDDSLLVRGTNESCVSSRVWEKTKRAKYYLSYSSAARKIALYH
jgi:hypothetical protein